MTANHQQKSSRTHRLAEFKLRENIIPQHSITQHSLTREIEGHKVRHSNHNNSAAECSISLKFDTSFIRSQAIHGKCSRSKVKSQGHQWRRQPSEVGEATLFALSPPFLSPSLPSLSPSLPSVSLPSPSPPSLPSLRSRPP